MDCPLETSPTKNININDVLKDFYYSRTPRGRVDIHGLITLTLCYAYCIHLTKQLGLRDKMLPMGDYNELWNKFITLNSDALNDYLNYT